MSLFWATFITGLALVVAGGALFFKQRTIAPALQAFPRSDRAAMVTMGLAAIWFLGGHIWQLSEADFGAYRGPLFVGFGLVGLLAWVYVREFLAVRGLAILLLLSAQTLLSSAAGHYDLPMRLFLVTFVYVMILGALYLGAVPYRLRDFFQWLFGTWRRSRLLGGLLGMYGLFLAVIAFTYS